MTTCTLTTFDQALPTLVKYTAFLGLSALCVIVLVGFARASYNLLR